MQHQVRVYLDEAGKFEAGQTAEMAAVVTHPTSMSATDVWSVIQRMRDKYGIRFKAHRVERLDMIRLAALIRAKGWLVFFYRLLPGERVNMTQLVRDALADLEQEGQVDRAAHPLANMDFGVLTTLNQRLSGNTETADRWFTLLWLLMKERNSEGRCLLGDWVIDRRRDIDVGVVQHLLMLNFVGFAPREEVQEVLHRVRVHSIEDSYRVTANAAREEGGEGLAIADYCAKFFRQAHVQYTRKAGDTKGFQIFLDILNTPNMNAAVLPADTDIPYWVENCATVWEHFAREGLQSTRRTFGTHPYRCRVFDWMLGNGFFGAEHVAPVGE